MIKLITLRKNKGKGFAIKAGLQKVKYDMVIIFDGDLELHPLEISKLMILDKKNNIHSALGYRFKKLNPLKSNFAWGNFIFTTFFNIIFNTNHKDILCCAKALYLNDIKNYKIISNGFDIDVELSFLVSIINKKRVIPQVKLDYKRRSIEEGKKLKISDGWGILLRIIKMMKFL